MLKGRHSRLAKWKKVQCGKHAQSRCCSSSHGEEVSQFRISSDEIRFIRQA
jgi:hypothetical protein